MYATQYEETDVSSSQWRVLHRIGARDPAGIKRAMKKYQVDNIPDLVALLEHHQPRHRFRDRLFTALGRVAGGYKTDPHADDTKRAFKHYYENEKLVEIRDRQKRVKRIQHDR